mgnify:CR=1 FL=1
MTEPKSFATLLTDGWRDLPFEPFRDGVEVYYLWREAEDAPVWAFLRYAPGASVPEHLHTGLETILVLEGSQSDAQGRYTAGTVVCNPKGTTHRVWSDEGCTVFIQWEKPVTFV